MILRADGSEKAWIREQDKSKYRLQLFLLKTYSRVKHNILQGRKYSTDTFYNERPIPIEIELKSMKFQKIVIFTNAGNDRADVMSSCWQIEINKSFASLLSADPSPRLYTYFQQRIVLSQKRLQGWCHVGAGGHGPSIWKAVPRWERFHFRQGTFMGTLSI